VAARTAVNIPIDKLVALEPSKFGMQWRCLIVTCGQRGQFLDADKALDAFATHLHERHRARGGVVRKSRKVRSERSLSAPAP
jgi:hypothetical protein